MWSSKCFAISWHFRSHDPRSRVQDILHREVARESAVPLFAALSEGVSRQFPRLEHSLTPTVRAYATHPHRLVLLPSCLRTEWRSADEALWYRVPVPS